MKCTGVWHRAKCTRCGNTDPTYHTGYDEHSMYVSSSRAATCTSSGYTTYTCSHGCGYSYTNTLGALGHDIHYWTEAYYPATCTSSAGATIKAQCSRCSLNWYGYESYGNPLGHNWEKSCLSSVCTTYCTRCGITK